MEHACFTKTKKKISWRLGGDTFLCNISTLMKLDFFQRKNCCREYNSTSSTGTQFHRQEQCYLTGRFSRISSSPTLAQLFLRTQNETDQGIQIKGSFLAQPKSSLTQLALRSHSFREGRDDLRWQRHLVHARDPKIRPTLLFWLPFIKKVPSLLEKTRWLNQIQAHLGSLSTEEQCSVWKNVIPLSPGLCGVEEPDHFLTLRNKYHLLEMRDSATVAQSGKSAHIGNKMSHEPSGVVWQYLATGSICQAVHQSVYGRIAPRIVYIPARWAQRPWYICTSPSCQPLT